MNTEQVPVKHLNEVERLIRELLVAMQKAKLQNEPVVEALRALELELGKARRERFDEHNSNFRGY
jgi:hypothetical protein